LGLLGMRERATYVGGTLIVKSAPGKGTTIQTQIPLGTARARGTLISQKPNLERL
jgi:signal transduction histidine kinase